jgi:hypothetical protein
VSDWPSEEIYSDASRAVRFSAGRLEIQTSNKNRQILYPYCAFRRFLVDGRFPGVTIDGHSINRGAVVSRLEIGLGFRRKKAADLALTFPDTLEVIKAVTQMHVTLQTQKESQPLFSLGPKLASAYLAASTRRKGGQSLPTEAWWFRVGAPLLVIEYGDGDIGELPKYSRHVTTLVRTGVQLDHCRIESHGMRFGVWFLGVNDSALTSVNKQRVRRLRLNLLRLHAERDSIRQILRLIAQERIAIKRGTTSSERLQQYLDESVRLLSKEHRDNLPQSEILEAAQDYEDFVTPGERETLGAQLSSIRKTLLQRLEKITEQSRAQSGIIYDIHATSVTFNYEQNGSKTVNTQTIDFGSGNTITDVNVVAARTIQESWNRTAGANINPELRNALQDLHKAVAGMSKQLPEPKQAETAKDLATLSSEALSQAPRKKWYELSAEGLLEAAKAVGETAAPVVTAVKTVLALLG